jgi:hypothetical protein
MKKFFLILLIICIIPNYAEAHSGGTDSNGGHWNRSSGTYHCHSPGCIDKDGGLLVRDSNEKVVNTKNDEADELINQTNKELIKLDFLNYIFKAALILGIVGLIIFFLGKRRVSSYFFVSALVLLGTDLAIKSSLDQMEDSISENIEHLSLIVQENSQSLKQKNIEITNLENEINHLITQNEIVDEQKAAEQKSKENKDQIESKIRSIKKGMTYKEVVSLLGVEGNLSSLNNFSGDSYEWAFPDGELGSYNLTIYFINGKVDRLYNF